VKAISDEVTKCFLGWESLTPSLQLTPHPSLTLSIT